MHRVGRGCEDLSGFIWLSTKSLSVFFQHGEEALGYKRHEDFFDYPNDERLNENSEVIRRTRGGTDSE